MHTFHIPVLGIGYSIDTPLKVAKYGIASVVSIIEDDLIEKMRAYHALKTGRPYTPITTREPDYRAQRITAYLNLMGDIVDSQVEASKEMPFDSDNDLVTYFELLPDRSELSQQFRTMSGMPDGPEKEKLKATLKASVIAGAIDVNIMAKVDNINYAADGSQLPTEYSDALSALRGFATSRLSSSLVISAGYNPRLFNYLESFSDFYPDEHGVQKKKIILKVSDFRSAHVQGKILAKKGIWVSEFRIESGLNCGGHAFATDGILLGPVLDEFKKRREELETELLSLCNQANETRGNQVYESLPKLKITVQGGIGTALEDEFLREYYQLEGTGWGSPFLLVPEATNVDTNTLQLLSTATKDDYYLSDASPLGVPFNNFRKSSAEVQRKERVAKGRPGSPCYKKYLSSNTEFTLTPICTASRKYQHLKIAQLNSQDLTPEEYRESVEKITGKDCLCEGLVSAVLHKDDLPLSHGLTAVTICPGPNLAYFSGTFSLREMIDHIYGRTNILNSLYRPNMFVNELGLYVDYLKKEINKCSDIFSKKQQVFFSSFRTNLQSGINYYKELLPNLKKETEQYTKRMMQELCDYQRAIDALPIPVIQKSTI